MKIVTRTQFMAYPAETVYSTYEPCYFGPLHIKGDTIIHDGKAIDWFEQQIADAIDASDSGEWADKLFEAQETGGSVAFDFDCQGRDGLFEEKQLYAVWEPQDVAALVERLQRCLPKSQYACGNCGKPIPGGCYCNAACAAADGEEQPLNGRNEHG